MRTYKEIVKNYILISKKKCKYRLSMKKLYGLNSDEDDIEDDDDPCDIE